eukprot:403337610
MRQKDQQLSVNIKRKYISSLNNDSSQQAVIQKKQDSFFRKLKVGILVLHNQGEQSIEQSSQNKSLSQLKVDALYQEMQSNSNTVTINSLSSFKKEVNVKYQRYIYEQENGHTQSLLQNEDKEYFSKFRIKYINEQVYEFGEDEEIQQELNKEKNLENHEVSENNYTDKDKNQANQDSDSKLINQSSGSEQKSQDKFFKNQLKINLCFAKDNIVVAQNQISLIQILGDIGGITNSLFLAGYILVLLFQDKLLHAKLIKSIYQTQQCSQFPDNQDDGQSKPRTSLKHKSSEKFLSTTSLYKLRRSPKKSNNKFSQNNLMNADNNFSSQDAKLILKNNITHILDELSSRVKFEFGLLDVFRNLYQFLKEKCKKPQLILKSQVKKDKSNQKSQSASKYINSSYHNFKKAEKLLAEEFDAVTLLQTVRQVKLLMGVFFNKHQMRLLQMQKGNVIKEDSPVHIRQQTQNLSRKDLMNNQQIENIGKKELFGTQASIKKSFNYFCEKPRLNLIDKRLLLGIFQRQIQLEDDVDLDDALEQNEIIKEYLELQFTSPRKFMEHQARVNDKNHQNGNLNQQQQDQKFEDEEEIYNRNNQQAILSPLYGQSYHEDNFTAHFKNQSQIDEIHSHQISDLKRRRLVFSPEAIINNQIAHANQKEYSIKKHQKNSPEQPFSIYRELHPIQHDKYSSQNINTSFGAQDIENENHGTQNLRLKVQQEALDLKLQKILGKSTVNASNVKNQVQEILQKANRSLSQRESNNQNKYNLESQFHQNEQQNTFQVNENLKSDNLSEVSLPKMPYVNCVRNKKQDRFKYAI